MPTKPNLGEFVEKDGNLYFIKSANLPGIHDTSPLGVFGHPTTRPAVGFAYLMGYAIALVVLIPILCLVILFPVPLFAFLLGIGALNFIQAA